MQHSQILKERIEQMLAWENASAGTLQIWLAAQGFVVSLEEITAMIRDIRNRERPVEQSKS